MKMRMFIYTLSPSCNDRMHKIYCYRKKDKILSLKSFTLRILIIQRFPVIEKILTYEKTKIL